MRNKFFGMTIMSLSNIVQECRWHSFITPGELEQAAVSEILRASQQAISLRGAFHLVLAGGTTPRRLYESLRFAETDWKAWHIYFGDERCLEPDHAERNSRMAELAWLNHVAIPAVQIHSIPAELGAETAAGHYNKTLNQIEQFDLVLLGLGEDGHTASLFPGHDWGNLSNAPSVLAVHDAPKPPPDRVSLSATRLGKAHQLMFLITGESKREAVRNWRTGINIPAASISPANGVDVYIEAILLERN
jgi:6-phosphogluconolactonase